MGGTATATLDLRDGRTRVALFPRTGRTHQLRVHAAPPDGLGLPIVGDRLYGQPGERMLLHAESLTFVNLDGRRVTVSDPAPF
jgi:tRNA pseudouridine32 synthase/23S rRNA pseudouridine746 synthase